MSLLQTSPYLVMESYVTIMWFTSSPSGFIQILWHFNCNRKKKEKKKIWGSIFQPLGLWVWCLPPQPCILCHKWALHWWLQVVNCSACEEALFEGHEQVKVGLHHGTFQLTAPAGGEIVLHPQRGLGKLFIFNNLYAGTRFVFDFLNYYYFYFHCWWIATFCRVNRGHIWYSWPATELFRNLVSLSRQSRFYIPFL